MKIIKVWDLFNDESYYFKSAKGLCEFMSWDYSQFVNCRSRNVGSDRFLFKKCLIEYIEVR